MFLEIYKYTNIVAEDFLNIVKKKFNQGPLVNIKSSSEDQYYQYLDVTHEDLIKYLKCWPISLKANIGRHLLHLQYTSDDTDFPISVKHLVQNLLNLPKYSSAMSSNIDSTTADNSDSEKNEFSQEFEDIKLLLKYIENRKIVRMPKSHRQIG